MKFQSETVLRHAPEAVFLAYRDRMPDVVPYLEEIRAVNVLDRQEEGDVVRLHNEWVADRDLPSFAKAFLKPEDLQWDDLAVWTLSSLGCSWTIRTRVFTDAVTCVGSNEFLAEGSGTRFRMNGTFEIALSGIPGVPGFMAKRIIPQVEALIVQTIQPNLEKTAEAVGRMLDAEASR